MGVLRKIQDFWLLIWSFLKLPWAPSMRNFHAQNRSEPVVRFLFSLWAWIGGLDANTCLSNQKICCNTPKNTVSNTLWCTRIGQHSVFLSMRFATSRAMSSGLDDRSVNGIRVAWRFGNPGSLGHYLPAQLWVVLIGVIFYLMLVDLVGVFHIYIYPICTPCKRYVRIYIPCARSISASSTRFLTALSRSQGNMQIMRILVEWNCPVNIAASRWNEKVPVWSPHGISFVLSVESQRTEPRETPIKNAQVEEVIAEAKWQALEFLKATSSFNLFLYVLVLDLFSYSTCKSDPFWQAYFPTGLKPLAIT